MTLNLIKTFKTSVYITNHTKNIYLHFQTYILFSNIHIFQKIIYLREPTATKKNVEENCVLFLIRRHTGSGRVE